VQDGATAQVPAALLLTMLTALATLGGDGALEEFEKAFKRTRNAETVQVRSFIRAV